MLIFFISKLYAISYLLMHKKPINPKKDTQNFDFINSIRCIAMIGIVMEHSSVLWADLYYGFGNKFIQASSIQFFKFATIAFFLISGFLINHKFSEYKPLEYLKNRFRNTIGPWLFWVAIFILANLGQMYVMHFRFSKPLVPLFDFINKQFINIVFYTSYWFILNFLICITILLIFRKHIYRLWFGILLGSISLFYSFNLYFKWIGTEHTTALFGFVFYLWLGVYINKYFGKISVYIKGISWYWVIFINVLLFITADLEIIHLMNIGSNDAFNTLRISNILYSISMFMVLLKIGSVKKLDQYLEPRKTTFGIYLVHQILIFRLLPEIFKPSKFNVEKMTVYEGVVYTGFRFLIVYVLSFYLVKLILKSKAKWVVGAR